MATVFGGHCFVCIEKRRGEQIVTIGFGGLTVIIVLSEGWYVSRWTGVCERGNLWPVCRADWSKEGEK